MKTIRRQFEDGDRTIGGWLMIPATLSAEAMARAGFDYVCVDTQHGNIDYQMAVEMIRAIDHGGCCPLVRVPWNEPGIIGKMLDGGAHGVIIPMVNSVSEAVAAVQACRYAPLGSRSSGPTVVRHRHDDYHAWANDNVACIPMIETRQAVDSIDEILAVEGIDAVYIGPADLSLTLGLPPANNDGTPAFDEAYARVVEACDRAGVVAGCHATGALVPRRFEQGFGMVTATADLLAMGMGAASELALARNDSGDGQLAAPTSGGLY